MYSFDGSGSKFPKLTSLTSVLSAAVRPSDAPAVRDQNGRMSPGCVALALSSTVMRRTSFARGSEPKVVALISIETVVDGPPRLNDDAVTSSVSLGLTSGSPSGVKVVSTRSARIAALAFTKSVTVAPFCLPSQIWYTALPASESSPRRVTKKLAVPAALRGFTAANSPSGVFRWTLARFALYDGSPAGWRIVARSLSHAANASAAAVA